MIYFAYGSNMDEARMRQRCSSARFLFKAKLPNFRLAFTRFSRTNGCGAADILPEGCGRLGSRVPHQRRTTRRPGKGRRCSRRRLQAFHRRCPSGRRPGSTDKGRHLRCSHEGKSVSQAQPGIQGTPGQRRNSVGPARGLYRTAQKDRNLMTL